MSETVERERAQEFLRHLCDVVAQHESETPNHFLSTKTRDRLIQQARDTYPDQTTATPAPRPAAFEAMREALITGKRFAQSHEAEDETAAYMIDIIDAALAQADAAVSGGERG